MLQRVSAKLFAFEVQRAHQYLLLATITLVATTLRFYKLGEWSFWGDEMITVIRAQSLFDNGFAFRPISLMLNHAALAWLGTSEWSARLVPALIGAISIPILYFPIRRMLGPGVALVAELLLAVSPWHLYWSQNARFYTALLLFYTLALLTFYLGIEEDRPWYMLLSILFLGLAVKERLIALFFIPIAGAYLVFLKVLPFEKPAGLRLRNLVLFSLPGMAGALYLALPYLQQQALWGTDFGQFFTWTNNSPFWIVAGVFYYAGVPTICLGALGGLYLLSKWNRAALLLSLAALVPLVVIAIVSLFYYTANRYVFLTLTSWLILAGVAARELFLQTPKSARMLGIGALLILLLVPMSENALYYAYQNGNRDNWKAAFALVKEQKKAGDLVVTADPLLGDYYLQEKTLNLGKVDPAQLIENGERVWFVEDMNVQWKFPRMLHWLEKNTQLVADLDVHVRARNFKMRVYLYDPDEIQDRMVIK